MTNKPDDKHKASDAVVVEEKQQSGWSTLWKTEDYWAIWLGVLLLIIGLFIFLPNPPADMHAKIAEYNAIMEQESERAPFRTIAYLEAERKMDRLRARNEEPGKTIGSYLVRPSNWKNNPVEAFYLSEEEAAARSAAAAAKHEQAKEKLESARAKADEAEAAAAAVGFQDAALNEKAREAIGAWRNAVEAESKAKNSATVKGYNHIPKLAVLGMGMAFLFAIGTRFMGRSVRQFLVGFPVVFIVATLSFSIAGQANLRAYGLEYVLWAIVLGLLISNTIGTPRWVMPAVQTEYYIKTGLVLLGASILFAQILLIGIPGIFVAWVVTPIVLIGTFWFGQNILKVPSKELNITVSADMSVCGVSAAIATAAACRAKKEELTLAVGMSVAFTAVMMFAMPAFINLVGMHHVWAGAWMGGTIDATGAVVAAGELVGPVAMYTAATIKMIQNILIGLIAFGVAAYWALKVERERTGVAGQVDLSFGGAMIEIWRRFPKFVLGFIGASIVFSTIYWAMGADAGKVMIDQGVLRGWANDLRTWFFALAFASIGLATNFRDLAEYFKGGKPLILYVCGQSFNVLLTLIMAYIMFFLVFPGITERIMGM